MTDNTHNIVYYTIDSKYGYSDPQMYTEEGAIAEVKATSFLWGALTAWVDGEPHAAYVDRDAAGREYIRVVEG